MRVIKLLGLMVTALFVGATVAASANQTRLNRKFEEDPQNASDRERVAGDAEPITTLDRECIPMTGGAEQVDTTATSNEPKVIDEVGRRETSLL